MKAKHTDQELYRVGNILYKDYWGTYDLILAVEWNDNGALWDVTAQECTKDGTPIAEPRHHCTSAWRNDHIVGTTLGLSEGPG